MKKIILTSKDLKMLRLLAEGIDDEQLTKSPQIKKQGVENFKNSYWTKLAHLIPCRPSSSSRDTGLRSGIDQKSDAERDKKVSLCSR